MIQIKTPISCDRCKSKEMKAVSLPVSKLLYDTEDSSEGILLKEKGEKGLRLSIPFEAPYQAQNAEIAVTALVAFEGSENVFYRYNRCSDHEGILSIQITRKNGKSFRKCLSGWRPQSWGIAAFIRQQERSRKRTCKKPWLLFAAVRQIKNMKPWQKNFVKVLTGQESVWCI